MYMICGKVLHYSKSLTLDEYWNVCGDFYEKYGITKNDFMKFSFKNGFNTGDIMILKGVKAEDLKIGDVIVYKGMRPDPIIHRIVKGWTRDGRFYFQTKGDHNEKSNPDELEISEERIIGKALFRIPMLGWIKIGFVELLRLIGVIR